MKIVISELEDYKTLRELDSATGALVVGGEGEVIASTTVELSAEGVGAFTDSFSFSIPISFELPGGGVFNGAFTLGGGAAGSFSLK